MPQLDQHEKSKVQTSRNREHQRNFRARRQQYIQELEQKVRACERAQLEATQKVQTAARVVASENEDLRALLRDKLGMTDEDIKRHIAELRRSQTSTQNVPTRNCGQDVSNTETESDKSVAVRESEPRPETCNQEASTSPELLAGQQYAWPLPEATRVPLDNRLPGLNRLNEWPEALPGHPHTPSAEERRSQNTANRAEMSIDPSSTSIPTSTPRCTITPVPDEMHCEQAATIIMSTRTNLTAADVLDELGCRWQVNCKVPNTDVFQAMSTWI